TVTKKTLPIFATQCGEQVVETDANETWPLDQVQNRPDTLTDGDIGCGKRLMDARFRRDHVAHPVVLETDDRVSNFAELTQRGLCLRPPTLAFERKRQRRQGDDERTGFA